MNERFLRTKPFENNFSGHKIWFSSLGGGIEGYIEIRCIYLFDDTYLENYNRAQFRYSCVLNEGGNKFNYIYNNFVLIY